ncbi:MAG: hypothetical protein ACKO7B_16525, partial [Flavobacteriales bacterium]
TNSNSYSNSSLTNAQVVTCQVTTAGSCPTFYNLGTGTTFNSLTSGAGAAYATYYGNGRQQYIIRSSELTALGLSAGSNIASIGFDVGSATGDPLTLNGFTIKMGNVSATASTTTFQTGATTVFGPVNYTPALNSINTHNLTTPFTWNGTSNIIVESCFSNQVVGNQAYQTRYTDPGFVAVTYYQADGTAGAGACTQATGTTSSNRPNMKFGVNGAGGSATSNSITVSVSAAVTPSVSIALTSGSNPGCAQSGWTYTATPTNGGTTPTYQWKLNGNNVGTGGSTYTNNALANNDVVSCVMTSNAACASSTTASSNSVTMTVNA